MRQEIIDRMNITAAGGEPFLFVIDYEGDGAYIHKLSEINPQECLYDFEGVGNVGKMDVRPLQRLLNGRWTNLAMRTMRRVSPS